MPRRQPDDLDRAIGRAIREAREARRLTQQELAFGLGITFQQVQKYEKGTSRVAASQLIRIARALRLDLATVWRVADL